MGLALAISVNNFYAGLKNIFGGKAENHTTSLIFIIANFLIFILTFIRFFWGDNRYLDLHYKELVTQIQLQQPMKIDAEFDKITGRRRFFDIVLLTIHGTIFMFLGFSIDNNIAFYLVYAILMLTNSLWLIYNEHLETIQVTVVKRLNKQRSALGQGGTIVQYFRSFDPNYAPRFWIKNNIWAFSFMFLSFLIYFFWDKYSDILFFTTMVIICLINCFLDFWKTWLFYFPKLSELIFPDINND